MKSPTFEVVGEPLRHHTQSLTGAVQMEDGSLLTADSSGALKRWSGEEVLCVQEWQSPEAILAVGGHNRTSTIIAVKRDEQVFLSVGSLVQAGEYLDIVGWESTLSFTPCQLVLSEDMRWIAACGVLGECALLSVSKQSLLWQLSAERNQPYDEMKVVFSPCGEYVYLIGSARRASQLEAGHIDESGRDNAVMNHVMMCRCEDGTFVRSFRAFDEDICDLAWVEERLVTSSTQKVSAWDGVSLQERWEAEDHGYICFCEEDNRLYLYDPEWGTLVALDVETGERLFEPFYVHHAELLVQGFFSLEGTLVAVGEQGLFLIEKEPLSLCESYNRRLFVSPDGRHVLDTQRLKAWTYTREWEASQVVLTQEMDECFDISPCGRYALGSRRNYLHLWDLRGESESRPLGGRLNDLNNMGVSMHWNRVVNAYFTPHDGVIAMIDSVQLYQLPETSWETVHVIRLVSLWTGEVIANLDQIKMDWKPKLSFSQDGKEVALYCGEQSTISRWDLESGAPLPTLRGHTRSVSGVEYVPEQDLLFSRCHRSLVLWERSTGTRLKRWLWGEFGEDFRYDSQYLCVGRERVMCASSRGDVVFVDLKDFSVRSWSGLTTLDIDAVASSDGEHWWYLTNAGSVIHLSGEYVEASDYSLKDVLQWTQMREQEGTQGRLKEIAALHGDIATVFDCGVACLTSELEGRDDLDTKTIGRMLVGDEPVLVHDRAHQARFSAISISPDRRFLAIGSPSGDSYAEGGALQIRDTLTGGCVVSIPHVGGGINYEGHARMLQWRPDGRAIAAFYNGELLGVWEIFKSDDHEPEMIVIPSEGTGHAKPFSWSPNGDSLAVTAWMQSDELFPLGLADLSKSPLYDVDTLQTFPEVDNPIAERSGNIARFAGVHWLQNDKIACFSQYDHLGIFDRKAQEYSLTASCLSLWGWDAAEYVVPDEGKRRLAWCGADAVYVYDAVEDMIVCRYHLTYTPHHFAFYFSPDGEYLCFLLPNQVEVIHVDTQRSVGLFETDYSSIERYGSFVSDRTLWSFARYSQRGVFLFESGEVGLFTFGEFEELSTPYLMLSLPSSLQGRRLSGVEWGADDLTIVAWTGQDVVIWESETGECIAHSDTGLGAEYPKTPATQDSLWQGRLNLASLLPGVIRYTPHGREEAWGCVLKGQLVANRVFLETMEEYVSVSVGKELALPLRWYRREGWGLCLESVEALFSEETLPSSLCAAFSLFSGWATPSQTNAFYRVAIAPNVQLPDGVQLDEVAFPSFQNAGLYRPVFCDGGHSIAHEWVGQCVIWEDRRYAHTQRQLAILIDVQADVVFLLMHDEVHEVNSADIGWIGLAQFAGEPFLLLPEHKPLHQPLLGLKVYVPEESPMFKEYERDDLVEKITSLGGTLQETFEGVDAVFIDHNELLDEADRVGLGVLSPFDLKSWLR
ncbi:MAG: hypothetical protein CL920_32625 [Deltaproteobacteria bacterium]|nr:hypothetical protein [Deltaproteobacteria bacterium]MBU53466.1 hypothetical protein [Deltaproteobacteria bacterium]